MAMLDTSNRKPRMENPGEAGGDGSTVITPQSSKQTPARRLSVEEQLRLAAGRSTSATDVGPAAPYTTSVSRPGIPRSSDGSGRWWVLLASLPSLVVGLIMLGRYLRSGAWPLDTEQTLLATFFLSVLLLLGVRQWLIERRVAEVIAHLRQHLGRESRAGKGEAEAVLATVKQVLEQHNHRRLP